MLCRACPSVLASIPYRLSPAACYVCSAPAPASTTHDVQLLSFQLTASDNSTVMAQCSVWAALLALCTVQLWKLSAVEAVEADFFHSRWGDQLCSKRPGQPFHLLTSGWLDPRRLATRQCTLVSDPNNPCSFKSVLGTNSFGAKGLLMFLGGASCAWRTGPHGALHTQLGMLPPALLELTGGA